MGHTVVLTSSAGSFPGLAEALREGGVPVEERPLIRFLPPADWAPVDAAVERLHSYGAVAFTSPRAAQALLDRIDVRRPPWQGQAGKTSIWAIGSITAAALRGRLGPVRIPSARQSPTLSAGAVLARAMLDAKVRGPVLFPCGETRRDELVVQLRGSGLAVEELVCYRSVLASTSEARAAAGRGTLLVVASPSVMDLLARACPDPSRPRLLAVGPTTAASAAAAGWSPAAIAPEPSAPALLTAIEALRQER